MADSKKMSVEEILAAARRTDGAGGGPADDSAKAAGGSEPSGSGEAAGQSGSGEEAAASGKSAAQSGPKSTADILAAARAEKAAKAAASGGGSSTGESPSAESKPAASKPAAGKKPGEMSVADVLAAARAEKEKAAGGKSSAPAATSKPEGKSAPRPKPPSGKGAAQTSAAAESPASGPKDTTSILAAARKSDKPGPVSRSEAAARRGPAVEAPQRPAKAKPQAPPMPRKPDYARGEQAARQSSERSERRGFLAAFFGVLVASPLAVGFSSLAVTHLLWVLGLARFMFPNILTEPPTQFKVGFPDEYGPGMVETKFKAQFGVWVVRAEYGGEPQIFALKTVCTHLGCTPNWLDGEQKFKCPCHGSGFYKDGINFEGPAPRPLERYAIRIADDGQLEVDKSRKFQQELGQWSDASSFVPV